MVRSLWRVRILVALLTAVYVLGCGSVELCGAQEGDIVWSEPLNLSSSPTGSVHPAIVADAFGNVHVFWSESMTGKAVTAGGLTDPPDTILYRRWDGEAWTEALDILAVTDDPLADNVAAAVDTRGHLHVVWTGLTQLYYSTAAVAEAHAVRAWSTPQVIASDSARTRYESDVAVDTQGNVHIVYATGGIAPDVLHTMLSQENGLWTMPVRVSDDLRADEMNLMDVRLVIDPSDRLHVAWSTANANGYGQAIYYARSEHAGQVWDAPVLLADATIDTGFTGFPSLLAPGGDELLLIHIDQGNRGRIERVSVDAGKTWSEPRPILPGMEGVNGFLVPLLDDGGGLHLVINMRPTSDQRVGIYYAPRAGLGWAPVLPVAVDQLSASSAHYADAAVRLGSEIHIAWTQLRTGEIWYVCGTISGLAPIPAQETPSALAPVAMPEQVGGVSANTTPEPTPRPVDAPTRLSADGPTPSGQGAAPWMSIAIAIAPVVLLVAGIMCWQTCKR